MPPRLSMSSMVSFESLYGMCYDLSFSESPLSILITLPSVKRLLLMLPVSFTMVYPSLLVSFRRSLPAKSTKEILPYFLYMRPSSGF